MGRELRRKEAKRNKGSAKETNTKENTDPKQEIYKTIKLLIVILLILVVVYLLIGIFITKEIKFDNNKKDQDTTTDMTDNKNILVSEIFRQSEEKYYVYFYDFNNTISSIDNALISKLYDQKIYNVDMGSGFNTKYQSEVGNKEAKTYEDLKIVTPTLILIENDTIIKYIEGEENILNYING